MALEETLDTGGIYADVRTPIGDHETAGELRDRLVVLGSELLVHEIDRCPARRPAPQVGEPTYAEKLEVEEFELDPVHAPAAELARFVRAWEPGAGRVVRGRWPPGEGAACPHRRRRRGRRRAGNDLHGGCAQVSRGWAAAGRSPARREASDAGSRVDGRTAWSGDRRWLTRGAAARPAANPGLAVTRPVVTARAVRLGRG